MNKVSDERHLAYYDIFPLAKGQVNVSKVYPKTLVAWHRHQNQIDQWFVLNGMLKVGTKLLDGEVQFRLLGPGEHLTIPMNTWHGYYALTETDLLYYCTNKYDGTDEERETVGAFGESWEVEAK